MFWEFGIVSSEIEDILDKETESTLEKLLDEPDLLQEVNSKNSRLIDYCSRQEVIDRIYTYAICEPDQSLDEANRYKYPMICSEILTAGIPSFDHVVLDDTNYFMRLMDGFNRSNLDNLMCNFMVKIFVYFVAEYPERLYDFVVSYNIELVDILLKHIEYASMCDAVLKLQSFELSTEMRSVFIELLYEQNIIGKLYRMITYDRSNEVKAAACNLFVEIIRIHRIRPTLFLDSFKYVENMILVEQAQSNNLLQILLDNMFAYTADENSLLVESTAENLSQDQQRIVRSIGKTINYGCIMLMSLFDSTRISDTYGDEFNEFGYIRNTILTVVSTDFELLSRYIEKFVSYLQKTVSAKLSTTPNVNAAAEDYDGKNCAVKMTLSSTTPPPPPFGTTNINIVRLLTVTTIYQCEVFEKALIKSDLFAILWRYLPYFSRNNALHSLLFECTSFILLSELYRNGPTYFVQKAYSKESVLAHLKTRHDFCSSSRTTTTTSADEKMDDKKPSVPTSDKSDFVLGKSALLHDHLINDIQLLLIILNLYDTCCYTVKCDFRGHLMQLAARLSKLPPSSLIPKNPDLSIVPSLIVDESLNAGNHPAAADLVKQKWELFCNTIVVQYRKDNEIDPNVFSASAFHEEHLDNLFRSFDSNFTPTSQDDQRVTSPTFSLNNNEDENNDNGNNCNIINGNIVSGGEAFKFQANVKLEVEQGVAYMESIKQCLLFGADNIKFPSRYINGSKNAFICSSDDDVDENSCFDDTAHRLPSFDMTANTAPASSMNFDDANAGSDQRYEELSAEAQAKIVAQSFDDQPAAETSTQEFSSSKSSQVKSTNLTKTSTTKNNPYDRMKDPYDNSFEFGERNNKYVESVMNDRLSTRLEGSLDINVSTSDGPTPNLSSNSTSTDLSSSPTSTLIDVDRIPAAAGDVQQLADNVFSGKPAKLLFLTPTTQNQPTSKSLSCYSDSDVFYSLPSMSDVAEPRDMSGGDSDKSSLPATECVGSSASTPNQEFASLTENIFQKNSSVDRTTTTTSSYDSENTDHDEKTADRKGTSSPIKLSLSYNSEEIYDDVDVDGGVFSAPPKSSTSESHPDDLSATATNNDQQDSKQ